VKRILILLLLSLISLTTRADEVKPPKEIMIGMDFDDAAAALRGAGAQEGHFFDAFSTNGPPKWSDFALPDRRTITLHAAPSELFPFIFRVTAIFVSQPSDYDLGKSNLKGGRKTERVEKFVIPALAKSRESE